MLKKVTGLMSGSISPDKDVRITTNNFEEELPEYVSGIKIFVSSLINKRR